MEVPGEQAYRTIGMKILVKKRGRIPRRWVFLCENGRPLAYLKVPRRTIQEIEGVAAFYGWSFEEAVVRLIEAGLETWFLKTGSPLGVLDRAREGIVFGEEHDESGQA
jgi:hypothetical protein